MRIELCDESLDLLPQRAILWPRRSTLLIADPHFGKDAAFRDAGIPVPGAALHEDLDRLSRLIADTHCQRLAILGDFFHAPAGRTEITMATLNQWRAAHAQLHIDLIEGNHDRRAGAPPGEWKIDYHPAPLADPPFLLRHEPPESPAPVHSLCGHLHPAAVVRDIGSLSAKFPCFSVGRHCTILPAFARFTGTRAVRPSRGGRVYVIADAAVVMLT